MLDAFLKISHSQKKNSWFAVLSSVFAAQKQPLQHDSKRCEFQSENSLKRNPQDNDRSEEEKRSFQKDT